MGPSYFYALFRMIELLLFLCLVAVLILCLLVGSAVLLQIYCTFRQPIDANRYHMHNE